MTTKTKCTSMMNKTGITKSVLTAICLSFLSACSENIRKTEDAVNQAKIRYEELLKQQTHEKKTVSDAERIIVPETHSWLYQVYEGSYRSPLREVLPIIVPGYPITYVMGSCSNNVDCINPVVHSTPSAVTYKDHLDSLSLQANVGYQFRNGVLLITPTVTREYEIPLYGGGTYEIEVGVSNLETDQLPGAGDIANDMKGDIVTTSDIHNLVTTSLGIPVCDSLDLTDQQDSPLFECYQIAPSGNLLTITARPQRLAAFEPIYDSWLESVTRQAVIKITTIQLDVTELAQQKVDISVIRNASIAGTLQSITSDVASSTIEASGSVMSVVINDPGSPWNTSNIIMQALESIGDASIEDTRELLIYNNRMVTLRDFVVTRYVSQISIERTDSGNTSRDTPTVEVGELETGQAINILPTLTDSLIAMHIVVNEAQIDGFRQYNLLGTSGTLPQNSGKDTVFDVTLQDNEAVLLASTIREENTFMSDESGILPVWPLKLIGPNAEEGRRRVLQTLYLIEGSFKI